MRPKDTPSTSPHFEQEIDENVMYIEDLDEEIYEVGDEDVENMEESQERNDAMCIFSKHIGLLIEY